jgi:hypothetical protein
MTITDHRSNAESIQIQPRLWFIFVYAFGFLIGSAVLDLCERFEITNVPVILRYVLPLPIAVAYWSMLRHWANRSLEKRESTDPG